MARMQAGPACALNCENHTDCSAVGAEINSKIVHFLAAAAAAVANLTGEKSSPIPPIRKIEVQLK